MADTAHELGMLVKRKNEPAFLSSEAHKKQEKDYFVKYTPNAPAGAINPDEKPMTRIIQISTQQVDPLEPPRHKHKKILTNNNEKPAVIMRSPPRKLTVQD